MDDVRDAQLPNGLRVLLRPLHVAPVVEVQFWVRVGAADERDGERGLAHFHEHMLFKGTPQRAAGEMASAIEGAGGRVNAFTSFDLTCYHATLPADALATGFEVLADALQHSHFDAEEVAREALVVREEIRRSDDSPHDVLGDLLFQNMFRVHPYRLPILGTHESVKRFERAQVSAFYRRWYTPRHMALVVAGDFDADAMFAQAQTLGARAPGETQRARPCEPAQDAPRVATLARPFERASLTLAWPAMQLAHADTPLADLLAFVLAGGESSRLQRSLKEESGLVDRVYTACYTPFEPGLFELSFDCDGARALAATEHAAREIERVRRELVTESELEKARRNFLAARAWERESVSGLASKLGTGLMLAGDPFYHEQYLERVRVARREDLLRVAETWLRPERTTLAAVLPREAHAEFSQARAHAALESGVREVVRKFAAARAKPNAAAAREKPETRERESAATASRKAVHTRKTRAQQNAPPQQFELSNGVRVFIAPQHDAPVVAARCALFGGQLLESEASAGLNSFLAGMWLRGTRRHNAKEFAERVESLASDVNSFSGHSTCGVTLDCTREQFSPVLALFAEALLAPTFDATEIERERRETLASLARREDELATRAYDLFRRTHYRAHPYRHPSSGTRETVTRITRADLEARQAQLLSAQNLVIAIAGDVEPERAAREVEKHFESAPRGARVEDAFAPDEPAPDATREHTERRAREQAHIALGFRGLRVTDPDCEALEVLQQILGGHGGRLFFELREKNSLAYAVSASSVLGAAPGHFIVYLGTTPARFDEALAALRGELARTLEAAPREDELERARRYLIGARAIARQHSSTRAMHTALDVRYGLGADADARYPERIAAIRGDDILRVARRILTLETATLAAIRP